MSEEGMPISWYPGHMAKTKRLLSENIKKVDIVLELVDARVPQSSRNPILAGLLGQKPGILLLNKSDMADPKVNELWLTHFDQNGNHALLCNSLNGRGTEKIPPLIRRILADKIRNYENKGMSRSLKVMIVGIPNVGKSSLINRLSNKKAAKVENRPGVTLQTQWIRLEEDLELLDTPGILWPKFEDKRVGYHLACTGAIKDTILDTVDIASFLALNLAGQYPDLLSMRYKFKLVPGSNGFDILEQIARKRGFLLSGGEADIERAANMLLLEFRTLKIGRISLERPETAE